MRSGKPTPAERLASAARREELRKAYAAGAKDMRKKLAKRFSQQGIRTEVSRIIRDCPLPGEKP